MKVTLKEAFNIPNMLGYFRLLLIPVFASLYMREQYMTAGLVAVVSGISDMLDGWIARRFNQVTDLGKVLDPIADKLTQGVAVLLLTDRFPMMLLLVAIWVIKEGYMAFAMFYNYKKHGVRLDGAKWYGKLSTWVVDSTMVVLLLLPAFPVYAANILIAACAFFMLFALHLYCQEYRSLIRKKTK
jgi:cardiolipin synthase